MSTDDVEGTLEELDHDECVRLLAAFSVGRIAVATAPDSSPFVVPVNYVLDGDVVVFRSAPGAKLAGIDRHAVSFQIDYIDGFHHSGWSVLVRGTAALAEPHEIAHLDLESWTSGPKHYLVRVIPHSITGRRVRAIDLPWDERGYL